MGRGGQRDHSLRRELSRDSHGRQCRDSPRSARESRSLHDVARSHRRTFTGGRRRRHVPASTRKRRARVIFAAVEDLPLDTSVAADQKVLPEMVVLAWRFLRRPGSDAASGCAVFLWRAAISCGSRESRFAALDHGAAASRRCVANVFQRAGSLGSRGLLLRQTFLQNHRLMVEAASTKTQVRPVKVLIVAASMDIVGGQAVQAVRLIEHLKQEPSVAVGFLPVNPRLPGMLRKLQSIKYVRTITTSILYWWKLLTTIPSFDV